MTVIEGFELGAVFSALLFWGWYMRSPALLYIFAGVAAVAELGGTVASQSPPREGIYGWIFVLGLAGAGVMLGRVR